MSNIDKAVVFMEDIAMDNTHGYDQAKRMGPDYDCSSLVGHALNYAGFNVRKASTTRDLYKQLKDAGFVEIAIKAPRLRGDIFLTPGKHVVMCTSEAAIVHASINEKGTITGGKTGDQTGKEICTRSFYTPSYGWKYHLRLKGVVVSVGNGVEYATSFDKKLGGKYKTTGKLHLRRGAGKNKTSLYIMSKGTEVQCYGYYTVNGSKWLLVTCGNLTGYCSMSYLTKVG